MTTGNRYAFRLLPGMRRGLRAETPLPTRLVSNEEFPPLPQTPAQRRVEDRILAEAARLAPRLGLSRRDFLRGSGGMATSLLAMNAVFGRFFDVQPVEAADPAAFKERSGDPYFIFDVQLHYVGAGYDPRDEETGRIGTYEAKFLIPNLNKEEKRIPISSVVLSSQRVDMRDALYNAAKDKGKSEAVNPLVQDGQKLIPSVTRVFSKSRDMYVYLQAYEPTAPSIQPLIAFVTFYRGQTKAFETSPISVSEGLDNRLKTIPLKFNFALEKLQAGKYDCQVTVLDPTSQKAAFWQAPIMLVP